MRAAVLGFVCAFVAREDVDDRRKVADALEVNGASEKARQALDDILRRLEQAAYGGATIDRRATESIVADAVKVMRALEAELTE